MGKFFISSVVKYSNKSSEGHRFDSCSERSNFFQVYPRSPSEMHSSHELPIAQWQSIRTSYWKVIGSSPCSEFSDICPSLSETASKNDISPLIIYLCRLTAPCLVHVRFEGYEVSSRKVKRSVLENLKYWVSSSENYFYF